MLKLKKLYFLSILLLFVFYLFNFNSTASAKSNIKLSKKRVVMDVNSRTTVKIKNSTAKVKWFASPKKLVWIKAVGKNKSNCNVFSKSKTGNVRLTAKSKGKKLICKITINNSEDDKESTTETPTQTTPSSSAAVNTLTTQNTTTVTAPPTISPTEAPVSSVQQIITPTAAPSYTASPSESTSYGADDYQRLLVAHVIKYGTKETDSKKRVFYSVSVSYKEYKMSITYYPTDKNLIFCNRIYNSTRYLISYISFTCGSDNCLLYNNYYNSTIDTTIEGLANTIIQNVGNKNYIAPTWTLSDGLASNNRATYEKFFNDCTQVSYDSMNIYFANHSDLGFTMHDLGFAE